VPAILQHAQHTQADVQRWRLDDGMAHTVQIIPKVGKLVIGQEPHRSQVEANDRRHIRVEQRARVQDDAIATQAHHKVNDLNPTPQLSVA
jgi:hypothetical protein